MFPTTAASRHATIVGMQRDAAKIVLRDVVILCNWGFTSDLLDLLQHGFYGLRRGQQALRNDMFRWRQVLLVPLDPFALQSLDDLWPLAGKIVGFFNILRDVVE